MSDIQTTLLLEVNGAYYDLDLYEEIPITANLSINSITELKERNAGFSNTFTLPGTKKNKQRFNSFYEVSGVDFNPLVRINCMVQNNGNDVFKGTLRLNSVINTDDYQEFEVYIVSDVGDFISELEGIKLVDLPWGDLYHELNYDNIITSWSATTGDTQGLFGGKVLYGLANFGYDYGTGQTPSFSIDLTGSTSFTGSSHPIPETYWKPQIRLKEIVDRIASATTYTVKSDFFETPYFRSIYMTLSQNGLLGINVAGEEQTNQNYFRIYTDNDIIIDRGDTDITQIPFNNYGENGFDFLNNYILNANDWSNTTITADDNVYLRNSFQTPYPGDYSFNIKFQTRKTVTGLFGQDFCINVYTASTPTTFLTTGSLVYQECHTANNNWKQINSFFTLSNMVGGEYVGVFIEHKPSPLTTNDKISFKPYSSDYGNASFYYDLYNSPYLTSTGNVDIQNQLPDFTAIDLMKNIVSMFNLLVIENDTEKSIEFIPFNDYYNQADREVKDWTDKLALDKSWKVSTLDFNLKKELEFTYKTGENENLNKFQEDNFSKIFGTMNYVSSNTILKGKDVIQAPFAAVPTNVIAGSEDFIIPQFWEYDDNFRRIPSKLKTPHLVFWVGNRHNYVDKYKSQQFTWYMSSGGTPQQITTYPCISHLSKLTEGANNTFTDLNFDRYWDYWQSNNDLINAYSQYTVYDTFYSQYISQLYSPEARKLEGKFVLTPDDIGNLSFNDVIFIKDTNYRLQEIKNGNLLKMDLNDVVLVKELGGYYSIDLPDPDYSVAPNSTFPPPATPTPTPTPQPNNCAPGVSCYNSYVSNQNPYSASFSYFDCGLGEYVTVLLGADNDSQEFCYCDGSLIMAGGMVENQIGYCGYATPTPTSTPNTSQTPTPTPSLSNLCFNYDIENTGEGPLEYSYKDCGDCAGATQYGVVSEGTIGSVCACENTVVITIGTGTITKGLAC